ncbi:MAG TPA: DNA/RNA nuclease SfsA [Phenylobacterium sp.]|jgi:sugar fermentation stimulation protein A|uniref:DNA/RNA nuclease SfsA n=1 Tax=Phenylobacterium sp. TaxID=1871053 RepID=UPI002C63CFE1|nr:DNA/RNA nuclease SfsA [Phenylobacterium sp.]HXA39905.1 DNA/RNA nuclease SfsA [Phenylobacterium sp.]
MLFPSPLARGTLVSRYKRFFAEVALDDGTEITAHCPNPGAMLGLNTPGLRAWVSRSDDPKRKLAHTLELVEADGGLVGVNTMHPNRLVAEALAADAIPELTGYATHRREVRYGENSRVDFLLEAPGRPPCWLEVNNVQPFYNARLKPDHKVWLEVKNVHLMRTTGLAEFPDCVAARSLKHLRELEAMIAEGDRAVVLFVVQRADCVAFSACRELDPAFAVGLDRAADAGVEVLIYTCDVAISGISISHRLPWSR